MYDATVYAIAAAAFTAGMILGLVREIWIVIPLLCLIAALLSAVWAYRSWRHAINVQIEAAKLQHPSS